MRVAASFVDLLQERAARQPGHVLYHFLENGEREAERLCIGVLDSRARAIGATLRQSCTRGERALLLYPPGLDFISAFFGCLYAGVAAVPTYPPGPSGGQARLSSIVRNSGARAVLTTSALHAQKERLGSRSPELSSALWLETDRIEPGPYRTWVPAPADEDEVAFLQYTSGSTGDPKGIMVTHRNLLENEAMIQRTFEQSERSVIVGWLPLYHDMGLIGNVLQPLYLGARCVLMSPLAFLQRPYRWLRAISEYRATTSGGPNFAYELCLRKVTREQRRNLDLSSWTVAFNGSEPVRPDTLERFAQEFGPYGFRATAFYPCYGLAEATLLVAGSKRRADAVIETVDGAALERHEVLPTPATAAGARRVVGCGQADDGQRLLIVDPETGKPCARDRVGEIWVAGPSVAAGYWGRPEAEVFQAASAETGERFLRTGDLGFLRDGELFVTGRLKDLIILRGRNLYPQDLELTAERSHPAIRPGCGAVFSVDVEGEERLVVVQEVERRAQSWLDTVQVGAAIRLALAREHQVQPHDVVLARAGTVPRTSSGKVRRQACHAAYLAGELARLDAPRTEGPVATAAVAPTPEELRTGTWEARQSRILAYLRAEVARLARLAPAAITADQPLISCGLDSLAAIELKAALEDRLGLTTSLSRLLEGATLADLAGEILSAPPPATGAAAGTATGREDGEHPLSYAQSALWYLDRLAPGSPVYNIVGAAAVNAELDIDALGRAFAALADRHPALRATFLDTNAGPRQRLGAGLPPSLTSEDASQLSPEELAERLCEEAYRPFDLAVGPLLRLHVLSRSAVEHVLVLAVHHITADFWSLAILLRELGALYAQESTGRPAGLVAPAYLYSVHIAAERERLAGPRGEVLWRYWRRRHARLSEDPPVLDLPLDRQRPAQQSFRGAACRWRLDRDAAAALGHLAAAHRATLYTGLLAVYEALLHRYGGQDEVVVGSPVAGRSFAHEATVVGYFVNTVLLDGNLAGEPAFATWLEEVRDTVFQALEHWDFPLPLLAERLRPDRDPARSPLCQAFFTLHRSPASMDPGLAAYALGEPGWPLDLGGLALRSVAIEERRAPFELALAAAELDGGISLVAQYATDLWDRGSIERLLGHFEALLLGACATPSEPISRLPLLRPAEREQLLGEWATAARAFPEAGLCVHELVECQAALWPDRCAMAAGRRELSYSELDARANRLARHLQDLGVAPETLVGVYAERSPELVVTLLAVLKAGGACLPLDPTLPGERLSHIAATSGISVILVQGDLPPLPVPEGVRTILLGEETGQYGLGTDADVRPGHPAYITFTSGSTGQPKGVVNTHRGLVNLLLWTREAYALTGEDRILQSTPLSFDFALWEIFAPLSAGARLVLTPPGGALDPGSLRALMANQGVTVVHFVPSMLRAFLAEPDLDGLDSLRLVLCGGEALPTELAHRLLARLPVELHHLYGPTEAAINALHQHLRPGDEVLLGGPLANLRCALLDRRQEPVPPGVPGEICLGGPGLARGYLGRPDLTAERFIPDPLSTRPGERLYRTGDLARRLPRCGLAYLGRVDHQIKIRGVRVEPAEVEAALATYPAVRETVVIARETDGRGKQLVAYVVPAPGTRPDGGELQAHLQATLPPAMIPALFVSLDRLPLTPSGKVDRKALPSPEAARADREAPRTPVEAQLAEIWSEVLGRQPVGVHENFFQLGGDSILSLQVAARARSRGLDLTAGHLLKHQTIAALAPRVRPLDPAPARPDAPLLPADLKSLREDPGVEDVYPLSPTQLSMLARSLQTGEYVNQLSWRVRGELAAGRFAEAWRETLQRHAALRVACLWEGLEEPVQVVHRTCELPWATLDWRDVPAAELEDRLEAFAEDDRRRGFELSRPPLMRFTLIQSGDSEHRLLWTHHHLLLDGWSVALILEEVLTRYHDPARAWAEPPSHCSFIAWLRSQDLTADEAFWRRELQGFQRSMPPESMEVEPSAPGREEIRLSVGETGDLRSLAKDHRLPMSTLVFGAWALLLGRSLGVEDVAFGMVVAGRSAPLPGIESLVGLLINTLPLRLPLPPDLPLPDWWAQVQKRQSELALREQTPLAAIERWSGVPRGTLFDSIAAFENYPVIRRAEGTVAFDDLRVVDPTGFPLALAATPGPSLALALSFDRRRTPLAEAAQRLRQLGAVLLGFAREPRSRLGELSSLAGVERMQTMLASVREARVGAPTAPPAAGLESRIGALWAEALGLAGVGRDDNFFELGGDSILSLQIASRASREGLRIPPRKIFEHPTVAALARALEGLQPADAGPEADPGPLPLTPIQRRFFEYLPADAHHWNQALVLDALEPLDSALLRQSCASLMRRHDALRLRFACEDGVWRQWVSAPSEEVPVHLVDLAALPAALREQAWADASAALQASLDLGQGPLLRVAGFRLAEDRMSRLLWIVHHLAVDTVSWRVLLEDFEAAYRHAWLPAPGISFSGWAERLCRQGPAKVAAALDDWLAGEARTAPRLPLELQGGANTEASAGTVSVRLTGEETHGLIRDLPRLDRIQPQEALLTALLAAVRPWTGESRLRVELEGHGREDLWEEIDLSRTVGWFTSVFPVLLELEEPAPLDRRAAQAVGRQLRRVPDRGVSYGMLRYLSDPGTALVSQPEVAFNFLGQFDATLAGVTLLRPRAEAPPALRSPRGLRRHLIEVAAWVAGGRLQVDFTYSRNLHRRATVEAVADGFAASLRALLAGRPMAPAGLISRQEMENAFSEVEL